MSQAGVSLFELAALMGAAIHGDETITVVEIADLVAAGPGALSFVTSAAFVEHLAMTRASAVILPAELVPQCPCAALVMDNPYLGYARATQRLNTTPIQMVGIDPSATVDASAEIDPTAAIGAGVVIDAEVRIGARVQIGPGSVVGRGCSIGAESRLWSNVTLYHEVQLGSNCLIHSGVVLGADGFGFANNAGHWEKVHQLGRVLIGNDVEIGANSTVDRGAIKDTIIRDGVKIDNLVHIAHNVEIGEHVAMAGCTAVAGSSVIGAGTTLAGGVGVLGHLTLAPGSHFTARTLVNRSNNVPGTFSSGTGMQTNQMWRKNVARFKQLDQMARRLKSLEQALKELNSTHTNK